MTISILEKAHIPLQKIQSEWLNIIAGGLHSLWVNTEAKHLPGLSGIKMCFVYIINLLSCTKTALGIFLFVCNQFEGWHNSRMPFYDLTNL